LFQTQTAYYNTHILVIDGIWLSTNNKPG
jgi:hypothetical protein